jgi:hypothetical protein
MHDVAWNKDSPGLSALERRVGRLHAKQRLGIEADVDAQGTRPGINFLQTDSWYSIHSMIRTTLRLTGLYGRACRNAERVEVRRNDLYLKRLPRRFDGFTLLHISDPHVDMNAGAMRRLCELLPDLHYDVCILTAIFAAPPSVPSSRRWKAGKPYAPVSKVPSSACWAITTASAWCPASRPWASPCCSTNVK